MDDDTAVRKLLELIFIKRTVYHEEISTANSSVPACLETREFTQCLHSVLSTKRVIILRRWKSFFDACCIKMFTSHEMYLKYMMFLCRAEHDYYKNIFDSFISVCSVLISLTEETIRKTNMNLCLLNPDIVMVFYKSVMKKKFRKSGGFQKFVEYIQSHRYLEINPPGANITSLNEAGIERVKEEYIKDRVFELVVNADDIYEDYASGVLGKKCLGSISIDLPPLLSKTELIWKLVEYKRSQLPKTSETESILNPEQSEEISNPVIDSTTGSVAEGTEDFSRVCDDLIEAVVNYSKNNPDLKILDESTLEEFEQSQMPETSAKNLKSELSEEISNPVIDSTAGSVVKEDEDLAEGYDETNKAVVKHNQEKPDLKISDESTLAEFKQSQMPETSAKNLKSELSEEISNPVIDSTAGSVVREKKDLAEGYDETIKAVVKHNPEKPDLKISDESTLKKAEVILENLKDDINSLIDVLNIDDGE